MGGPSLPSQRRLRGAGGAPAEQRLLPSGDAQGRRRSAGPTFPSRGSARAGSVQPGAAPLLQCGRVSEVSRSLLLIVETPQLFKALSKL